MSQIVPKEELRLIYGEIVRGSSYFYSENYGEVIIKHLTQHDTEMLDIKKLKYKRKAEDKGLPTEEQRAKSRRPHSRQDMDRSKRKRYKIWSRVHL